MNYIGKNFEEFMEQYSQDDIMRYIKEMYVNIDDDAFLQFVGEYIALWKDMTMYFDEDDEIIPYSKIHLLSKKQREEYAERFNGWDSLNRKDIEVLMESDEDSIISFIEECVLEAISNIEDYIRYNTNEENQRIKVFRGMDVNTDDYLNVLENDNSYQHLGLCWSIDESVADSFQSNGVIIEAEISQENIDWLNTIGVNVHPSLGEEEKELRLYNHSIINILKIKIKNEEIDFKEKKRQFFIANDESDYIIDSSDSKNLNKSLYTINDEEYVKYRMQHIDTYENNKKSLNKLNNPKNNLDKTKKRKSNEM